MLEDISLITHQILSFLISIVLEKTLLPEVRRLADAEAKECLEELGGEELAEAVRESVALNHCAYKSLVGFFT